MLSLVVGLITSNGKDFMHIQYENKFNNYRNYRKWRTTALNSLWKMGGMSWENKLSFFAFSFSFLKSSKGIFYLHGASIHSTRHPLWFIKKISSRKQLSLNLSFESGLEESLCGVRIKLGFIKEKE